MATTETARSSYLRHLPDIFADDPFAGRFLLAFEQILTGLEQPESEPRHSLEQMIAELAQLFDPAAARDDFLGWLAGWAALTLEADWSVVQQRQFLSRVVPLYRRRGTRENLRELLRIYTGADPVIDEGVDTAFQIRVHSTLGVDTRLGGSLPHHFHVAVAMAALDDPARARRQQQLVTALVDLEKPAHTYYHLTITFTTMQIGVRSTIGRDTLLGNLPAKPS
jgi:phage tail-like protein